jgi:hypothetical protein
MKNKLFFTLYLLIVSVFFYKVNKTQSEIPKSAIINGLKSLKNPSSIKLFGIYDFPDNSIYIWGWMPIYGLNSNQLPATKTATFEQEIFEDRPFINFYRNNLIKSLLSNNTGIIINANTNGGIGHEGLFKNITFFPEMQNLISKDYYIYNSSITENCPIVYFNKQYKYLLISRFVNPKTSYVDTFIDNWGGEKLIDKNITGQCKDSWLLPDRTLGNAIIAFDNSTVTKIAILNSNTRPYAPASGTKSVTLDLYNGKSKVFTKSVELEPYPYWTMVELPAPTYSDSIKVKINSFFGNGAGLSEILLYK